MIKPIAFCLIFLSNLVGHEKEIELYRSDRILQQAFQENATHKDFELAAQELSVFERSLEGFLVSRRSKNARGLLLWVEMDIVVKNDWMFKRLQDLRTKIENQTVKK